MGNQKDRWPDGPDVRIEVRPAVGRYDDFYEVVGVKKPGGGGCWCMSYRDSRVSNDERPGYMRDLCETEPGPGVLVYVDDVVAGWCSIAPRSTYRRLMNSRTIPFVDDRDAWVAVCFVVRAGYRKRGLMHDLLAGAVEHARAHGAEVVEGYPADVGPDRVDVISGYVGTVRMFEQAGFERAAETSGVSGGRRRWVMRKELVVDGGAASSVAG
jgi:GNAT superfamily N-acetyltransferase